MNYLVTGGAGYIGSHMVKMLQEHNHDVTVLDNLSTGFMDLINDCEIINIDIKNKSLVDESLSKKNYDGVFHFAAKSIVNESFDKPEEYRKNNVDGTTNLIESMIKYEINNLIFSSSAAVYGNNHNQIIKESDNIKPSNPYGETKVESENMISNYCEKEDLRAISFRYFNAAGAHPSGMIGEKHEPETHLIPNLIKSIINNQYNFELFGGIDNPTSDGTCVRDYIHVSDIVNAHYLGMKKIQNLKPYNVFNIGSGKGYSIMEIINGVEAVTNKKIDYTAFKRQEK
jgi:UDP-glucose 4-epimerase